MPTLSEIKFMESFGEVHPSNLPIHLDTHEGSTPSFPMPNDEEPEHHIPDLVLPPPMLPLPDAFTPPSSANSTIPSAIEAPGFFIYHRADRVCDTRLLFEDSATPVAIQISTLKILNGEGNAQDVETVRQHRLTLPIYSNFCASIYGFQPANEAENIWWANQTVWDDYCLTSVENAQKRYVVEQEQEETYAEVLSDVYDFCIVDPSDIGSRESSEIDFRIGSYINDRFGGKRGHFSSDDDRGMSGLNDLSWEEEEEHRGRSPQSRRATGARKEFEEGETW